MIQLQSPHGVSAPTLVAAFEGWNDAGEASSDAIEHLIDIWDAELVAEVDPEDFYDFQVTRPMVRLIEGEQREITWPTSRLYLARPRGGVNPVLLLHGIEPNMRWRGFCTDILASCEAMGVRTVLTLGALLADTPHTRPVAVTGTATDEDLIKSYDLSRSRYEGPTGIVGVLQEMARSRGLSAMSFWAAVPHYASSSPSPKVTAALLRRVEDVIDVAVPLGSLPEDAEDWVRSVDEMVAEDEDIADYVRQLEEREADNTLTNASGEAIAKEFERYLRRRGSD